MTEWENSALSETIVNLDLMLFFLNRNVTYFTKSSIDSSSIFLCWPFLLPADAVRSASGLPSSPDVFASALLPLLGRDLDLAVGAISPTSLNVLSYFCGTVSSIENYMKKLCHYWESVALINRYDTKKIMEE